MNDTFAKAMSEQITLEHESSIAYLQLAVALDDIDLPGMASWMRAQSDEERVHAAKFTDHMLDRRHRPVIGPVSAPKDPGDDVVEIFAAALAHEQKVSEAIRRLYRLAQQHDDIDSLPLLHWFIEEQVHEESTVETILGRLQHISSSRGEGLLLLDNELGQRRG